MNRKELKKSARVLVNKYAANELKEGYQAEALHCYEDIKGNIIYCRIRLKHPVTGKKWIRPFHLDENKNEYVLGEPEFPHGKPLYNLFEISKNMDDDVWIFEGEKCVDHAKKLGILGTTSGSSTSASNADWTPLAGRNVIIWRDNSVDGLNYATEVDEILNQLNCHVLHVDIEILNLPDKGDIVDWLEKNPGATKNDIYSLKLIEENAWPDPAPIKNELIAVDSLSQVLIPKPYRNFVVDVANRMQCPIDFVAIPLLVITSIIIGTACGIKPKKEDDWIVIANLWGIIVGRPGIMKSPAVSESMQFLDKIQNESKKEYDEEFKEYTKELNLYEQRKKILEKESERSIEHELGIVTAKGKRCPPLSQEKIKELISSIPEPLKPTWKRFKTNDSTLEKLIVLLVENRKGMLVFRDEIIALLRSFDKIGHETDRQFYLEAWSGTGSFNVDRITRGSDIADSLCISLLGTTQPDKLLKYLSSALNGDNDGLIQRFQLMVYPDDINDWKLIDIKPDITARKSVFDIFKKLCEVSYVSQGAEINEGDRFPYFSFNEKAQAIYNEWIVDLEKNKIRNHDLHPLLIDHLGKYRSLMPSLALIFHLIEIVSQTDINPSPLISEENALLACAWCDYLESHAKRIYGLVIDAASHAVIALADKIKRGKLKDCFTWRDIQRSEWTNLKNKKVVEEACEELIEKGWLRKSETSHGNPAYLINPKLKHSINNE